MISGSLTPCNKRGLLPRCYQDRTTQPISRPVGGIVVVVSCGVTWSEVGLAEIVNRRLEIPRHLGLIFRRGQGRGGHGPAHGRREEGSVSLFAFFSFRLRRLYLIHPENSDRPK